eukprot:1793072-Prymnesium_polylepis.1
MQVHTSSSHACCRHSSTAARTPALGTNGIRSHAACRTGLLHMQPLLLIQSLAGLKPLLACASLKKCGTALAKS